MSSTAHCRHGASGRARAENWLRQPTQRQTEEGPEDSDQQTTKDVTGPVRADVNAAQSRSGNQRRDRRPAHVAKQTGKTARQKNNRQRAKPEEEGDVSAGKAETDEFV